MAVRGGSNCRRHNTRAPQVAATPRQTRLIVWAVLPCYTNKMQLAQTKCGPIEYRVAGNGHKTVVIFPGGHMDASVHLGEDYFIEHGYRAIIVSRPGYGRTPLANGNTPDAFADAVAELIAKLGIKAFIAVGISAGGRSAVWTAKKYPHLVSKLILQSAAGFMPWPEGFTRVMARLAFNPYAQKYTWGLMRWLIARHPSTGVKVMLSNMTTLPVGDVMHSLSPADFKGLKELFSKLASGRGFMNDCRPPQAMPTNVAVPTLIIHSKYDKSVSLDHARSLQRLILDAQLYVSDAKSHMIWYDSAYRDIKEVMTGFLTS